MRKQNRVAFFNILSTVLLRGISIITAPIISRLMGDAGYGIVSIYMVWVNVLQIVFTLNTAATLVTAQVEYSGKELDRYASSVLSLSLLSCGVFSALTLVFLTPVSRFLKLPEQVVVLMLAHVIAGYCVNFLHNKFIYEYRADINCIVSVVVALLNIGLSVLFILLMPRELDYYGRILALTVTYGLVGFASCGYVLKKGRQFVHKTYWKFCLPLCIPLVFYALSDILLGYTDRLMLQYLATESTVGQYSMAYSFAVIMFTIFGALNNTWVPFFFEDYKKGETEQVRRQAKNYLELFTVLSVGFVLLTKEVYHLFIGRGFWPGTDLVPIFVLGFYLNFLCTFPVNVEYYYKKTKAVVVVTVAAALVNVGLNLILIRRIGIMGAVIATAASHGVQFLLHYWYARYRLGKAAYPFKTELWWKYAVAFFAALAVYYLVPNGWWFRWGLGAAIGCWELYRIYKRKVLI